jgi:hypothetical protein
VDFFRLNKIGKSPLLVSKREDLASDCKQINDLVSAMSAAECASAQSTVQGGALGVQHGLSHLGQLLAFPGLPIGDLPPRGAEGPGDERPCRPGLAIGLTHNPHYREEAERGPGAHHRVGDCPLRTRLSPPQTRPSRQSSLEAAAGRWSRQGSLELEGPRPPGPRAGGEGGLGRGRKREQGPEASRVTLGR